MCYYPTMGVMHTIEGEVFACHKELRDYFDPDWTTAQASKVEFKLRHVGNTTRLVWRIETVCTVIWNPSLRCIMPELRLIQNAMRDWLHHRETPIRQQAMLFLQDTLPCDMVGLVVQALH